MPKCWNRRRIGRYSLYVWISCLSAFFIFAFGLPISAKHAPNWTAAIILRGEVFVILAIVLVLGSAAYLGWLALLIIDLAIGPPFAKRKTVWEAARRAHTARV